MVGERQQSWEENTLKPVLEKLPERQKEFTTIDDDLPIKRLYTPLDLQNSDFEQDIGYPGEYPFTRGIHPTGYRGKLPTSRLFAGFGDAKDTNTRFKYLLEQGQEGLSTAFDMPTLLGYDSDDPEAPGEFGRGGVACSSLKDMELLFKDIPLDKVSVSMTINGPAAPIWAMFIANTDNQGIPRSKLKGTLQNDILKEFTAQNEYIFPHESSMRLVADTIEFAITDMSQFNPISISGYHIRERGSTAVQELAFTLADGFAYIDECLKRGTNINDVGKKLTFFFNAHNGFFEEIAKYRAARRIWAKEMKDKYKASDPKAMMLRFHTQTAGVSLKAQGIENNIIRATIQSLGAYLGGTQSLHTDAMDEAIALPNEHSAKIALRTQQIIAYESGATNTVDPLAGSYFVESLTDEMEKQAREYFRRINGYGGVIPAIKAGFFEREIADASYRYEREKDQGQRVVVGVNRFIDPVSIVKNEHKLSPDSQIRQLERLENLRSTRDSGKVSNALKELEDACRTNKNVMPYLIEASKAYATLGDMTRTMQKVFGTYRGPLIV